METNRAARKLLDRLADGCTHVRIVIVCAVATLVVACVLPTGTKQTRPAALDPAQAERINDLYKRASAHNKSGEPAEAEALLVEADKLAPQNASIVYDLACARALQEGKHELAGF